MPNRDDKSWLDALSGGPLNVLNYPGYAAGATQFAGNALSNIARSMSPVRFQEGEDAGFYPQVPPMISETAGAWNRLFGKQDNWHDGPGEVYPGDQNADAATAALAFYGGNALNPLAVKPAGSVGMFAGRNAKTANHAALAKAEQMAASGADRNAVWNETGWFQGPDQKWRFEIDDSGAKFTQPQEEAFALDRRPIDGSAAFVFRHPELFNAYPELAGTKTRILPDDNFSPGGFEGSYGGGRIDGSANALGGAREMLLHELTHGVQEGAENFARGGNPDFGIPRDLAAVEARKAYELNKARQERGARADDDLLFEELFGPEPKLSREWDQLTQREQLEWLDAGRGRVYHNLAGEVEARTVQARQNLSPEERQARPPWLDYDVPESDQIVRLLSDNKPSILGAAAATADQPSLTKQISDYTSEGIFLKPEYKITTSSMPQASFDGKTIRASQLSIIPKSLKYWRKQIASGARPGILLEETDPGKFRIVDGHTRATAYRDEGVSDIPVIIRDRKPGETLFSDNKPSILGAAAATADQPQGITAYHGSPHDFDKFSLDKIGTGEGAQAYGHGLYFAENEGVARGYRDSLTNARAAFDDTSPEGVAQRAVDVHGGDTAKAIAETESTLWTLQKNYEKFKDTKPEIAGNYQKQIERYSGALRLLDEGKHLGGRMYQVRINADPNDFLDWDKPLREQSERVRGALEGAYAGAVAKTGYPVPLLENLPASEHYRSLSNALGERYRQPYVEGDPFSGGLGMPITDHKSSAAVLREAGIPGIRYLDGNSRAAGAGSANYVVFDDAMIEILKKYGMAGAVLGAGQLGLGLTGSEANASEFDPELEDILRRYGGY